MWRNVLKEHGYVSISNNVESGGVFLVAVKGELFRIDDDFQVGHNNWGYDAVGCGVYYALGSLKALEANSKLKPKERLVKSLDIAKFFSNGCGGENSIIFIPNSNSKVVV